MGQPFRGNPSCPVLDMYWQRFDLNLFRGRRFEKFLQTLCSKFILQQVISKLSWSFDPDTTRAEGTDIVAEQIGLVGIVQINVEPVREHEFHTPQRIPRSWLHAQQARESLRLNSVPIDPLCIDKRPLLLP